jgi:hypothetical protein
MPRFPRSFRQTGDIATASTCWRRDVLVIMLSDIDRAKPPFRQITSAEMMSHTRKRIWQPWTAAHQGYKSRWLKGRDSRGHVVSNQN